LVNGLPLVQIELKRAGLALGTDYPRPIVALGEGRERALAALASLKPN